MSTSDHNHNAGQADYTDKDVRIKPLFIFIMVCMVMMVLTILGMNFLMHKLNNDLVKSDNLSNVYSAERQLPENGPVLQGLDQARIDLKKLHAEENALLTQYDWIDKQAGTVRIPVDQAVSILVNKGYPVRESSAK